MVTWNPTGGNFKGPAGPANTLTIGTVTTTAPGSSATASVTGTAPNQTLNLGLPQGATGPQGPAVTTHAASHATGGADPISPFSIGAAIIDHEHEASDITTGTVAFLRLPTGTAADTVAVGNDARFTDSRTPTTHAASHGSAGSDPVTPAAIGAATTAHVHAAADINSGTVDFNRLPTGTTNATVAVGNHDHLTLKAPVNLTDAATIATNAALSNHFTVTIAANRTLGVPTNPTHGQRVVWEVTASGADRTLSLTTGSEDSFIFGSDITGLTPVINGKTDFIFAIYSNAAHRWRIVAYVKGY